MEEGSGLRPSAPATSEQRQSHLVFSCGSSWYAVPAECAAEVVSLPELTRVPGAPAHLLGVFAHRGEVVPVLEMAALTGTVGGAAPASAQGSLEGGRAVLLRLARGCLALTASKVAGVSPLTGSFQPLGTSGVQMHLRGPARSVHTDVAVIDAEGLFDFLSQGGHSSP